MPVELLMTPFMKPIIKARSFMMSFQNEADHYTPIIKNGMGPNPVKLIVRKEFGTGSKIFSVFTNNLNQPYSNKIYSMTRSRAVKGAYRMYENSSTDPICSLRAGLNSNVLLYKTADLSEIELGWHAVEHKVDILDHYQIFHLADGNTYQWTYKGHFLERVHNLGEKEAEVRERVAQVKPHANKLGFDLEFNPDISPEMVIATAMICYVEFWNTIRAYGGNYDAKQRKTGVFWQRE